MPANLIWRPTVPNLSQPDLPILPEKTQRQTGLDARRTNILAARTVATALRTTLGPRGMDKMLVDKDGRTVVTNDGVTILREMKLDHPAAKMLVEIAMTQEAEVGDGTTTVTVLTGALLDGAEKLLDQKLHPTIIVKGFRKAAREGTAFLEGIARRVGPEDDDLLEQVAITSMTGRSPEDAAPHLARLVVEAIKRVAEEDGEGFRVDLGDVQLKRKGGGEFTDSQRIEGVIVDRERAHPGMPRKVVWAVPSAPTIIINTESETPA